MLVDRIRQKQGAYIIMLTIHLNKNQVSVWGFFRVAILRGLPAKIRPRLCICANSPEGLFCMLQRNRYLSWRQTIASW